MNKAIKIALLVIAAGLIWGCEKSTVEDKQEAKSAAIFTGTDLHGATTPKNIKELVQLASHNFSETEPSVFLIGGDCADRFSIDSTGNEVFSISSVVDAIKSGCLKRHNKYFFTYGSHDSDCTDAPYSFFSGPAALDNYYLYGISFAQMYIAEDSLATQYQGLDSVDSFGKSAKTASKKFVRWVNSLQDNAPIVIMSHMPIHANRGDNLGGKIWCEAINEVANNHDIFLLFGHNHTIENNPTSNPQGNQEPPTATGNNPEGQGELGDGEPDKPDDSAQQPEPRTNPYNEQDFYLVLPGSRIPIQTAEKDIIDSLTINFTYVNAGYICNGIASKITFTDIDNNGRYDRVSIKKYTVCDTTLTHFGNTGISNPYISDLIHRQ